MFRNCTVGILNANCNMYRFRRATTLASVVRVFHGKGYGKSAEENQNEEKRRKNTSQERGGIQNIHPCTAGYTRSDETEKDIRFSLQ